MGLIFRWAAEFIFLRSPTDRSRNAQQNKNVISWKSDPILSMLRDGLRNPVSKTLSLPEKWKRNHARGTGNHTLLIFQPKVARRIQHWSRRKRCPAMADVEIRRGEGLKIAYWPHVQEMQTSLCGLEGRGCSVKGSNKSRGKLTLRIAILSLYSLPSKETTIFCRKEFFHTRSNKIVSAHSSWKIQSNFISQSYLNVPFFGGRNDKYLSTWLSEHFDACETFCSSIVWTSCGQLTKQKNLTGKEINFIFIREENVAFQVPHGATMNQTCPPPPFLSSFCHDTVHFTKTQCIPLQEKVLFDLFANFQMYLQSTLVMLVATFATVRAEDKKKDIPNKYTVTEEAWFEVEVKDLDGPGQVLDRKYNSKRKKERKKKRKKERERENENEYEWKNVIFVPIFVKT